VSITTYFTASVVYLFLPMLPDLGLFRDEMRKRGSGRRARLYGLMAIGWTGSPGQRRRLGLAITIMMILIIPIAVSVHTVVSWIFAMTVREPWDSTIFGPFFVAGAIFSGIAVLIVVMAILRKAYHLEEYIQEKHFVYLGYLLAAMAMIMIYANLAEYITTGYKLNEDSEFHFRQLFAGRFAVLAWYYFVGGLLLPPLLILLPFTRNMKGVLVAAVLVVVAMWIERYLIVVASLRVPLMPYEPSNYAPTWVELSLMAASFALFALLITLFVKLFPILAVWEIAEEHEGRAEEAVNSERAPSGGLAAPEPAGGS
jgi:molybdopterin-containing oxidoreductase family membrane subunit